MQNGVDPISELHASSSSAGTALIAFAGVMDEFIDHAKKVTCKKVRTKVREYRNFL